MKIEICSNTQEVITPIVICVAALLTICFAMLCFKWVDREAIKAGLEQTQIEGSTSLKWTKPVPEIVLE